MRHVGLNGRVTADDGIGAVVWAQVGDGESWKQMTVLGLGQQTVKSVAPTSAAVDLRLEMNVEPR